MFLVCRFFIQVGQVVPNIGIGIGSIEAGANCCNMCCLLLKQFLTKLIKHPAELDSNVSDIAII